MILRTAKWLVVLAACFAAGSSVHGSLDAILNYSPPKSIRVEENTHEEAISEIAAAPMIKEDKILTQKELVDDLLTQLVKKYKPSGELKIEPLQRWNDYELPSSVWSTEIYSAPEMLTESRFALGFKLFSGGEQIGSWQLPVHATHVVEAFVSTRHINAGSRLENMDFEKKELDTLRIHKGLLPTNNVALGNYEARRTISSRKPLFWDDIVARTLVDKGAYVQAIAKRGRMEITIKAKALEDGSLGDIIVLRNMESDNRIEGEVIDEDKVLVYF